MKLPIDHLVYATVDLDSTVAELAERMGVRASPGGQHVGRGTHNALAHLGGRTYLEIIGPDPSQNMPSGTALPFGIESMTEAGLAWYALACSDLTTTVDAVRAAGLSAGAPFAMQRARPDGVLLRWELASHAEIPDGGAVPFLIDWLDSPHPSADTPRGCTLIALEVRHPEPERIRRHLELLAQHCAGDPQRADPEVNVVEADEARLVARIDTPRGVITLS